MKIHSLPSPLLDFARLAFVNRTILRIAAAILMTLILGPLSLTNPVQAQVLRTIENPGPSDLMKSERQRTRANELSLRYLGTPLRGGSLRNLRILQRLVDGNFIPKEDIMDQQVLGLVLGDVMAQNLNLKWIIIDDKIGHSRALRFKDTQPIFFPITMISKRMTAKEKVNIQALYDPVAAEVEKLVASYGQ